jgi:hypothetical protein
MAVQRYVVTTGVTVGPGTPATPTAGQPGTGGAAGFGSAPTTGGPPWATTYQVGQVLALDPAGPLYGLIGAPNLRSFVDGQDTQRTRLARDAQITQAR